MSKLVYIQVTADNVAWAVEMTGYSEAYVREALRLAKVNGVECSLPAQQYYTEDELHHHNVFTDYDAMPMGDEIEGGGPE